MSKISCHGDRGFVDEVLLHPCSSFGSWVAQLLIFKFEMGEGMFLRSVITSRAESRLNRDVISAYYHALCYGMLWSIVH